MIKQSTKIKRGTPYIVIETGDEVKHNIIDPDGNHLVDYPNGSWATFSPGELKLLQKKGTPISNNPKKLNETEKQNKADRNEFFTEVAKYMPFNCMNCQKPLYAFTAWSKRCCTAHILPKSKFPSIAENKDNIVFMGVDLIAGICNCHTEFDSSFESREKMPIYTLVLSRYQKLLPLLTSKEIVMANDYLLGKI